MRRAVTMLMAAGLLWAGATSGRASPPVAGTPAPGSTGVVRAQPPATGKTARAPARASAAPRVKTVTLSIRHRVFHEFRQVSEVKLREEFPVGDSPYTARVVEFVPDFSLNLDTRKVVSLSHQPRNPAFRVIVLEKGAPSDTAWAFLNMPPHFSRNSLLSFQVARIDFVDRAAITASDTTLLRRTRP